MQKLTIYSKESNLELNRAVVDIKNGLSFQLIFRKCRPYFKFFLDPVPEVPSPKDNNDDRIIASHHGQGVCQHNGYPYEGHVCTQGSELNKVLTDQFGLVLRRLKIQFKTYKRVITWSNGARYESCWTSWRAPRRTSWWTSYATIWTSVLWPMLFES